MMSNQSNIIGDFIEDVWEVLTPEMIERLKCVLTEDLGLTKMDADKFIQCQRDIRRQRICLKKNKRFVRIGPRNQWIKELSKDIADPMAVFIVGILLSNRTSLTKRLTENILDHLCELTGENTTIESAETRIERTMVVIADRMATWIDETICDVERKIKDDYETAAPFEDLLRESMKSLKTESFTEIEDNSYLDISSNQQLSTDESLSSVTAEEKESAQSEMEEEVSEEESEQEESSEESEGTISRESSLKEDEEEVETEQEEEEIETDQEEEEIETEQEEEEIETEQEDDDVSTEQEDEEDEMEKEEEIEAITEEKGEEQKEQTKDEEPIEEEVDKSTIGSIKDSDEEMILKGEGEPDLSDQESKELSSLKDLEDVSEIMSEKEKKKLPFDFLDLLKEDMKRIPKGEQISDRQKAMKNIIDKRLENIAKEKTGKSLDSLERYNIDDSALIAANWIENILPSSVDLPPPSVLPLSSRRGSAFEVTRNGGSRYEVHKLSSTTVAEKVAKVRGLEPFMQNRKIPKTMSPLNLKSTKDWADWALGAANVGEEWGKWLNTTLDDVEQQLLNDRSSESHLERYQDWTNWRNTKVQEARKWRAEKQRIKDEGSVWNRKLQN